MNLLPVALVSVVATQGVPAPQPPVPAITDPLAVPYIAQPAHLCGGAAMAMVERYWGRRGVYASDFAHLVREDLDGIVTTELKDAARTRGWSPHLVRSTATVRQLLRAGVPVIALIEASPARNHYVVLLSWSDRQVTYHDPAIAPSRSRPTDEFLAQWSRTGQWAMAVLPGDGHDRDSPRTPTADSVAGTSPPDSPASSRSGHCHRSIRRAVELAEADHEDAAADLLQGTLAECAESTRVRRTLAEIRFRQKEWSAAGRLAAAHVRAHANDRHGWALLGASRFLSGNDAGALDAWNAIGQPRIDLVTIEGLERTRFRPIAQGLGLAAGDTLRARDLEHARRRLEEVPSVLASRIRYRPVGNGMAEVRAHVLEREWSGGSASAVGETVARSLVHREIRVEVISPMGGGERLSASWIWPSPRRRIRLGLDAPAPFGLTGTVHVTGQLARETFVSGADLSPALEARRSAEIAYADWIAPRVRLRVGGGLDRWDAAGDYGMARAAATLRPDKHRFALSVRAAFWASPGAPEFGRVGARADWRSTTNPSPTLVTARLGVEYASAATPRLEWPRAGISREGSVALRAHRLIRDDIVAGPTLGRTMVHGGLAADRWVGGPAPLRLGVGAFVDAAAMWQAHLARTAPYYVDLGVGLRVGTGLGSTVLRLDAAQALIDSGRAVSVSLATPWPA